MQLARSALTWSAIQAEGITWAALGGLDVVRSQPAIIARCMETAAASTKSFVLGVLEKLQEVGQAVNGGDLPIVCWE